MIRQPVLLPAVAALLLASAGAMAAACGTPPSGELTAQRIVSVQPTREGPGLYEGPVWVGGALYFSDFGFGQGFPSRIRRLAADGTVTTVVEDSGSNGLAVDARGDLVVATHKDKALVRHALADGRRSTIAARFGDNVFNSPNDIAVATDGTMYFTDPDYQKAAAPGGQGVTGIYRVGTDGKVTLVDGSRRNPNGIALSPAGDVLYANASDGKLLAYPIRAGVPGPGRTVVDGLDGPDGMTVDCLGNLYVTEHGARRVRVFAPDGKSLATIQVDANVTNAAFGGADGRTLFITGAGAVWRVGLGVTGSPY
jgi:gluconolactonase